MCSWVREKKRGLLLFDQSNWVASRYEPMSVYYKLDNTGRNDIHSFSLRPHTHALIPPVKWKGHSRSCTKQSRKQKIQKKKQTNNLILYFLTITTTTTLAFFFFRNGIKVIVSWKILKVFSLSLYLIKIQVPILINLKYNKIRSSQVRG